MTDKAPKHQMVMWSRRWGKTKLREILNQHNRDEISDRELKRLLNVEVGANHNSTPRKGLRIKGFPVNPGTFNYTNDSVEWKQQTIIIDETGKKTIIDL